MQKPLHPKLLEIVRAFYCCLCRLLWQVLSVIDLILLLWPISMSTVPFHLPSFFHPWQLVITSTIIISSESERKIWSLFCFLFRAKIPIGRISTVCSIRITDFLPKEHQLLRRSVNYITALEVAHSSIWLITAILYFLFIDSWNSKLNFILLQVNLIFTSNALYTLKRRILSLLWAHWFLMISEHLVLIIILTCMTILMTKFRD